MRLRLIAFSAKGMETGARLAGSFAARGDETELSRCAAGGLETWTAENFPLADGLIFVGSCGIAVRAIAPFVKSKTTDPAVLAVDELGRFCVPLLSGHIGGANELALTAAGYLGAVPVVTTATDINGVFAVDTWARRRGFAIIEPERIKTVSSLLLSGGTARLKSDFPTAGAAPKNVALTDGKCDICVSCRADGGGALHLVPRVVTLGLGCRRGAPEEQIEAVFAAALERAGCRGEAVARVCSIDLKAGEPGILEFCRRRGLPFETFTAEELSGVEGDFSGSAFVKSITGVDNVCERSAVLGSRGGVLIAGKTVGEGATAALAMADYTLCFDTEGETI